MKKISFFICTRGKSATLKDTILSIKKINTSFYIDITIVVNSNNTFKLKKKYKNYNSKKFKIYFVEERKKGIPYARNKCLEIIRNNKNIHFASFIDDDCIVHDSWLDEMIKVYNYSKADIITGPQISINNNIYEEILERKIKHLSKIKWAATNNIFFNASKFKKINLLFSEKLKNLGGSDQLFFMQLSKMGFKIIWNSKAKVFEKRTHSNSNLKWFIRRNLRYGSSTKLIYTNVYGLFTGIFLTNLKILYEILLSINYLFLSLIKPKVNILKSFMHVLRTFGIIIGLFGFKFNEYN